MCVLSVQCNKVQRGCPFIIHLHHMAAQGRRVTWVTTSEAKRERLILTSCGANRANLTHTHTDIFTELTNSDDIRFKIHEPVRWSTLNFLKSQLNFYDLLFTTTMTRHCCSQYIFLYVCMYVCV